MNSCMVIFRQKQPIWAHTAQAVRKSARFFVEFSTYFQTLRIAKLPDICDIGTKYALMGRKNITIEQTNCYFSLEPKTKIFSFLCCFEKSMVTNGQNQQNSPNRSIRMSIMMLRSKKPSVFLNCLLYFEHLFSSVYQFS